MILTNQQTAGRYAARSPRPKRMRAWRIQQTLGAMDAELSRLLPEWVREAKSMLPVERKPAGSLECMKALRDDPAVTKTTLLVGFLYAAHADTRTGDGAFPSGAQLAQEGGISLRQVVTSTARLVSLGYLEWTGRYASRSGVKVYRMTAPVQPLHRGCALSA